MNDLRKANADLKNEVRKLRRQSTNSRMFSTSSSETQTSDSFIMFHTRDNLETEEIIETQNAQNSDIIVETSNRFTLLQEDFPLLNGDQAQTHPQIHSQPLWYARESSSNSNPQLTETVIRSPPEPTTERGYANYFTQSSRNRRDSINVNEIRTNGQPSERVHVRTEANDILILSDSIYRGIVQRKLAPRNYINKQYIPGGSEEMLRHIETMPGEEGTIHYKDVIIHTATNDLEIKQKNEICQNIAATIAAAQEKWPGSRITISGLTYRKDTKTNELINEINEQSKMTCNHFQNACFLDNRMVTTKPSGNIDYDAFYDNVHLNNRKGTKKLAANLKRHLGLKRQLNRGTENRSQYTRSERPYFNHNRYSQSYNHSESQIREAVRVLCNWAEYGAPHSNR